MNIKKLWQNELKTREQVQKKYSEYLKEYANYIKLGNLYNWNNNIIFIDTCKRMQKDLFIFKQWLNEF